ncbi:MAG: efflux RND transporter periplasmic adaptor subunit [Chloroflexi bacterium]|nr:efflux RND transporter periplasmic adaptor subunit [Chloroflexota bacterium]
MNKRFLIGIPIVLVLAVLGVFGYRQYLAPLPPTPTAGAAGPLAAAPALVSAEGRVQPAQAARLSFGSGGRVTEILVSPGDAVQAGQPLARLDNTAAAQAGVAAAQLELEAAQQAYDALFEELDLARAAAERALADARAAVRDNQRRVTNLGAPSKQTEIDKAQANVVLLKDRLERAQDDFEPYANKPEDNLIRATLQQKLAAAQQAYDDAVRLLNNLQGTADEIDLAQAQADLDAARARQALAADDLAALENGPDPDALALAQARLTNARAQLAAAEETLAKQELRAPFAGTVVNVDLQVGEYAAPGLGQVALAGLAGWEVETTDLAEADVALLSVGLPARVTLDAFPGLVFEGVITEVGLLGVDVRGQITYPVTIVFDPGDTPVRWGMTAFVDVEVGE